ncbi:MAG: leucine-rich repeat domain-containing protein [Alphaproteobacteria bacterium]|jgi:hypothetical protein|nr:leucine-rich repeat domain-containing protein [Alphaproteobacteria bacterium]MBP9876861.1 leucine-rich repeat domain-containing protein [Alphaproteobacteria bacterium]
MSAIEMNPEVLTAEEFVALCPKETVRSVYVSMKVLGPIKGLLCHRCKADIYKYLLAFDDWCPEVHDQELKSRRVYRDISNVRKCFEGEAGQYWASKSQMAEVYPHFKAYVSGLIQEEEQAYLNMRTIDVTIENIPYILSNMLHTYEEGFYPIQHSHRIYLDQLSFDYFLRKSADVIPQVEEVSKWDPEANEIKKYRRIRHPVFLFKKHFKAFEEARHHALSVLGLSRDQMNEKNAEFIEIYQEFRREIQRTDRQAIHFSFHDKNLILLPPEVYELDKLETLDLSENHLASLPPGISALQNLRSIDLRGSHLLFLPVGELCTLKQLKTIYVCEPQGFVSMMPPIYSQKLRDAGIELIAAGLMMSAIKF